ncbi:hypothetical protein [Streptomyces rochei]|uniref:hypothetical protein n=1 Tax=Streptomyces rochei TaxID=1928 RepID=UPI003401207A
MGEQSSVPMGSVRTRSIGRRAATLAHLLRSDLLSEAWTAPRPVREERATLRHRAQLVRLRTLLRNRIHAVSAHHGCDRAAGCWSAPGRIWLIELPLPCASRQVIEDLLETIDALQVIIDRAGRLLGQRSQRRPAGEGTHGAAWRRTARRDDHRCGGR